MINRSILWLTFPLLLGSFATGYFCRDQIVPQKINKSELELKSSVGLPKEYFDDFVGIWGNASGSGQTQWKAGDSRYTERSTPIPVIHPIELKKENESIHVVKSEEMAKDYGYQEAQNDIYKQYGETMGSFFWNKGQGISSIQEFDVDSDGKKETVIETDDIGANHPPHHGFIIKNNAVILSMPLINEGIYPTKDSNGFYVRYKLYDDAGACCSTGYRLYRVVYENGEFKPVWEQDVIYLRF